MSDKSIKTGKEILNEYFSKLSQDSTIDVDLRKTLVHLWNQEKLYTKTHLARALDSLREEKSK